MTQSSRRPDPYVLEVQPWTGAAVETKRIATHSLTTSPTDTPSNTFYDGRLVDPGKFSSILFAEGATSGGADIGTGYLEISNVDGGLDAWIDYGWDGRSFILKALSSADAPLTSATILMKGRIAGIQSSDALKRFSLRLRDPLADLNVPLLTQRYGGTVIGPGASIDGGPEIAGQIIPRAWGVNLNVPGKLVNPYNLIYQFAGNQQASITLYEGGLPWTNVGDFGAISSLVNAAADIPAGRYATCLAQGCILAGSSPEQAFTADLVEGAAGSDRSAARIAQRMLALTEYEHERINSSTFDTFHTFNTSQVGQYVADDRTALETISEVMDSVGGVLFVTRLDELRAIGIGAPSSTVSDTLTLRDISSEGNSSIVLFSGPSIDGQGIPAWSVIVNWGRLWQTQLGGDLYGAVTDARRALLAQQWQTVTASDSAVLTAHLLAKQLTFNTLLASQVAAQTEAERRLALYKVRRDRLQIPVAFDRGKDIEVGQTIKVQLPRLSGYAGGRNMLVIGRDDDYSNRRIVLTLWG